MTVTITAKGECEMMTSTVEQAGGAATAPTGEGKPDKKARVGARRANTAPSKAKAAKKASPGKKAPKGAKKATGARDGSKAAKILDLLKRPGGATAKELGKASGWQAHSGRGFLSD